MHTEMDTNGGSVIQGRWPRRSNTSGAVPYDALRAEVAGALDRCRVGVRAFSHFGIVVTDVRETVAALADSDPSWIGVEPVWGAAFECDIARQVVDGLEYELLQPVGKSFLRDALLRHGEGLHHVSFTVSDLDAAVTLLLAAQGRMDHPDICEGLHGRIAFLRIPQSIPASLELCQPHLSG